MGRESWTIKRREQSECYQAYTHPSVSRIRIYYDPAALTSCPDGLYTLTPDLKQTLSLSSCFCESIFFFTTAAEVDTKTEVLVAPTLIVDTKTQHEMRPPQQAQGRAGWNGHLLGVASVLDPRRHRQMKKSVLAEAITPRRGSPRKLAGRQTMKSAAKRAGGS